MNEARVSKDGTVNLNGWFQKSLFGFAALVITTLTMLITNVIANDKTSTHEHIKIRQEYKEGDEKVLLTVEKRLDKIEDKIDRLLIKDRYERRDERP